MTVQDIHHNAALESCLTMLAWGIEGVEMRSTAHPIVMLDHTLSQVQVEDRLEVGLLWNFKVFNVYATYCCNICSHHIMFGITVLMICAFGVSAAIIPIPWNVSVPSIVATL